MQAATITGDRLAGGALVSASLLSILVMAHHPSGQGRHDGPRVADLRLRILVAHVARPNPPERQQRELASSLEVIGDDASDVILAGDFNSTPWSFTLRRFDEASTLQRHTRALPTWPAQAWTRFYLPAIAPFLPIDHVYSGSRWRLTSLRRGPRTSSDHYPIEATFQAG